MYEKIHACHNDCIIYMNEYMDAETCPTCNQSKWKVEENATGKKRHVSTKNLWYSPTIPRFQRIFGTKQIAKDLTWIAYE